MAVFATDRLVVDRLLALRRPKEDRAEKEGEGREDDGFWPLLAVQLLGTSSSLVDLDKGT